MSSGKLIFIFLFHEAQEHNSAAENSSSHRRTFPCIKRKDSCIFKPHFDNSIGTCFFSNFFFFFNFSKVILVTLPHTPWLVTFSSAESSDLRLLGFKATLRLVLPWLASLTSDLFASSWSPRVKAYLLLRRFTGFTQRNYICTRNPPE